MPTPNSTTNEHQDDDQKSQESNSNKKLMTTDDWVGVTFAIVTGAIGIYPVGASFIIADLTMKIGFDAAGIMLGTVTTLAILTIALFITLIATKSRKAITTIIMTLCILSVINASGCALLLSSIKH